MARGPPMEAYGPAWLLRLAAHVCRMRLYISSLYLEGSRKISSRRHGEAVESDFARRPWSVSAAWLLRLPPGGTRRMGRWPATRAQGVYVAVGLPPGTRSRGGSLASRGVRTPHGCGAYHRGSASPDGSLAGCPLRLPLAYRPDADRQPPCRVLTAWLLCLPPRERITGWIVGQPPGFESVYMAVGLPPGTRSRGGSLASRGVYTLYTPHGCWPTTRCSTFNTGRILGQLPQGPKSTLNGNIRPLGRANLTEAQGGKEISFSTRAAAPLI